MGLIKNKKGFFFTVTTIMLLLVFLLGYSIYSMSKDRSSVSRRIDSLNNFVFSFEKDINRHLYITGFRVIFLCEKKIAETGKPITNISAVLEEAFYNGTIYGNEESFMIGARLSDIQKKLSDVGAIVNVNGTIKPKSIRFLQEDPWNIKIEMVAEIFIFDKGNLASWNNTKTFYAYIPITYFEDPLYVMHTNGLSTNKINKTIYYPFVSENDVSNLIKHSENSLYTNSSLAPSFIYRLEDKIEPNPNGIESLVNAEKLSLVGIPIRDTSVVDYIYLLDNRVPSNRTQGMPDWFKLDENHSSLYQVSGLIRN